MLHAFTVDVEDYFQVSGFADQVRADDWGTFPSRVERSTHRLLDLLDRRQVKATFFVLGWVAERHPALVRAIHDAGHELASHSYWHRLVYELSPEQFRDDLRRSRQVIEDSAGVRVDAFRAASFSITARSLWALEILAEEGFRRDSSIYPVHHDRYGIPGAEYRPYRIETPSGVIEEFPPAVRRWGKLNLPVGGGGYFRLYPLPFSLACLKGVEQKEQRPIMFYVHPWEVDVDQPRMKGSRSATFRHYVNLARTERKLDGLLAQLQFGTMKESWSQWIQSAGSAPTVDLESMGTAKTLASTLP